MSFCTRFLDEHDDDVDALREEVRRRGVYGIPLTASKAEVKAFEHDVKKSCTRTILLLSMEALHDEFDFGNRGRNGFPGRMDRFLNRCKTKMDCMVDDRVSWDDMEKFLREKLGLNEDKLKWIDD